jgi:hypothetical protein
LGDEVFTSLNNSGRLLARPSAGARQLQPMAGKLIKAASKPTAIALLSMNFSYTLPHSL